MSGQPKAPPGPPPAAKQSEAANGFEFKLNRGVTRKAHRIVLYGTGGIGKTTLASLLTEVGLEPIFIDLDSGSQDLDVQRIQPGDEWTFERLRAALQSPKWTDRRVVIIDSLTKAQELAAAHVCENIATATNNQAKSLEDYGYGKGYQHLYETMLMLLADCDRIVERGVNVLLICHDSRANVPNPMGTDYLRYEPLLYHSTTGKASVRDAVKSWCDHLLFLAYDVAASKDGKATGSGTRTIYAREGPTFLAKSRTLTELVYRYPAGDAGIWKALFGKES